ncbi:MAG: hypothetical protein VXV96_01180 [Bdellovibrionota bacterium]|jgi:uncharacterized coiled-coil DUF342 family protein|nr:hypothetical protein [Bdellovibrionota bacterium]
MKDQVVEKLKEVEEKLQNGSTLENQDIVFLFGLSLLKDQANGD